MRNWASCSDRLAASPGETVQQWLVRNGQTPRLVELLWEPLAVAALNQPIDRAAALPFTRVLAQMFGPDARDSAIALPLKPLDEMYAEPARAYLEAHGSAVRNNAVARIVTRDERVSHVAVRDETFHAPTVVCAAPWFAWPEIFVDRPPALGAVLQAAERTAASPIFTVNLWFDRVVLDEPFVGLPGRTMQWVFEKRIAFGERDLIRNALDEVVDALPAARDATLRRATVVREKRATFSLAPGQPPRPATRTSLPGLLLAGDWIDTGLPATIESAVVSGHWAAAAAALSA